MLASGFMHARQHSCMLVSIHACSYAHVSFGWLADALAVCGYLCRLHINLYTWHEYVHKYTYVHVYVRACMHVEMFAFLCVH